MRGSKRFQVPLLATFVSVAMFNLTLVTPILPDFVRSGFDLDNQAIGVFTSAEMVAYIFLAPVWGYLSDRRLGRRPLVVMGLFVSAPLFAIMPLIPSFWALVAVRFVQGAFTVAAWSLAMTMALDWAGEADRGRTMGVLGAGMMLGMALGAPIGGVLADRAGTDVVFYAAAAIFVAAALASVLVLGEPPERRRRERAGRPKRPWWGLLSDQWVPGAYSFVDRFTAGFFITIFTAMLVDDLAASTSQAGMYLGLLFLPFALFQYPFGRLVDRWGPVPFLVGGSVVYAAAMMAVPRLGAATLGVAMFLMGSMAAALMPASLVLVGRASAPEDHGVSMGLFNALGSVGFAAGLMLSGTLADALGYTWAFTAGAVSVLAVLAMTVVPLVRRFGGPSTGTEGTVG